jgi:hypothetical protein
MLLPNLRPAKHTLERESDDASLDGAALLHAEKNVPHVLIKVLVLLHSLKRLSPTSQRQFLVLLLSKMQDLSSILWILVVSNI